MGWRRFLLGLACSTAVCSIHEQHGHGMGLALNGNSLAAVCVGTTGAGYVVVVVQVTPNQTVVGSGGPRIVDIDTY